MSKLPEIKSLQEAEHIRNMMNAKCVAEKEYEIYLGLLKARTASVDDQTEIADAMEQTRTTFYKLFDLLSEARTIFETESRKIQQQSPSLFGETKRDMTPERSPNRFLFK